MARLGLRRGPRPLARLRLQHLDPIPEGICEIRAAAVLQGLVVDHSIPALSTAFEQFCEAADPQRRMRLGCRTEAPVHAEMNLHALTLEPTTSARREVLGLRDFDQAKHAAVEGPRFVFTTGGHRELDVVEGADPHLLEDTRGAA